MADGEPEIARGEFEFGDGLEVPGCGVELGAIGQDAAGACVSADDIFELACLFFGQGDFGHGGRGAGAAADVFEESGEDLFGVGVFECTILEALAEGIELGGIGQFIACDAGGIVQFLQMLLLDGIEFQRDTHSRTPGVSELTGLL